MHILSEELQLHGLFVVKSHMSGSHVSGSFVYYWYHCQEEEKGEGLGRMEEKTHHHNPHLQHKQPESKWIWAADGDV